jgi:hypothetical protein
MGVIEEPAGGARPLDDDSRWLLAALGVGLALGLFSVLADGIIRVRIVITLGNIISPWAVVAFAVGRLAASPRRGALAGTVALGTGVVTYYLVQGVRFAAAFDEPLAVYLMSPWHLVWYAGALTMGPIMGLAGAATRQIRPPVAAAAALSVVLAAEAGFLVLDRRPWLWDLTREAYRLADLAVMVALVAVAVAVPARLLHERRRRCSAYAVVLGAVACGPFALAGLYRVIAAM